MIETSYKLIDKRITNPIAVIFPVYHNVEMTIASLNSAIHGIIEVKDSKLVIINDASKDYGMEDALVEFSAKWKETVCLLSNNTNLGFVRTANRGMKYFTKYDIVLLNSDTILPNHWLIKLAKEAYKYNNAATVTPFSNSTTICTFPNFLQDNKSIYGLSVQKINDTFSRKILDCIEAPSGIGFCMYIKRKVIKKIGYFDAGIFEKGYGEENDFCQRAMVAGFKNIITPNLYVYHKGGVSFGSEKESRLKEAYKKMEKLHPNYHQDVQYFIAKDPLRGARTYRHLQIIADINKPKILHISHGLGGGVDQHIDELIKKYENKIVSVVMIPHDNTNGVKLKLGSSAHADSIIYNLPEKMNELLEMLKFLNFSLIHFHQTINLNRDLLNLPKTIGVEHILTIHDYYLISGNPTLTDKNSVYIKEKCDVHNDLYQLPSGISPKEWRNQHRKVIETAKLVIYPSLASKEIFSSYFNCRNVVAHHPEQNRFTTRKVKKIQKKDIYNIGIIGAISKEKGADVIESLALISKKKSLKVRFIIIGYAYRNLKRVKITGPYNPSELKTKTEDNDIDIAMFPALWPETYSYTLSYAMDLGLPIFATNVGAFPERLNNRKNTKLYNYQLNSENILYKLVEFIDILSSDIETKPISFTSSFLVDHYFYEDRYIKLCLLKKSLNKTLHSTSFFTNNSASLTFGEKLTLHLWRLYNNKFFKPISIMIPVYLLKNIRKCFSKKPISQILKITKY